MYFLHKDEFEAEFNARYEDPVVLEQNELPGEAGGLAVILDRQTLNNLQDVNNHILCLTPP